MTTAELLDALWRDYTAITPQAARIHARFAERGEVIANDHVALRTYDRVGEGRFTLGRRFEALGWVRQGDYRFPDKHLIASHWRHPEPGLPKVFVSELVVGELPAPAAAIVERLIAALPPGFVDRADLPWAGRPWPVSHADYRALLEVSEYAAWVAAFGFRVNHFTVDVNRLRTFADLAEVNAFVRGAGFALNQVGGAIKGTPADHLEQSSTTAEPIEVEFSDGRFAVPSCYYEFARRYPLPDGSLFQGFVPTSADKLFHSTDARR